MMQIVRAAMKPFCEADRCHIEGPDFKVPPQTAVTLALALHEAGDQCFQIRVA